MSERAWKPNAKWVRRVHRQFAALCAGFNATTDYCVIRKRKYRKAWLTGMYARNGWPMIGPFQRAAVKGVTA